jgi:tripartite-type tricarboxylate transporter receptor subunit TctC
MRTCGRPRVSVALVAWLGMIGGTAAQHYPVRPIVMVAPFPAGAPVDAVGRIVAERMRVSLGQAIIIENVSGGGGSIGVARAAHAAADGYTISLGNFSSHVLAAIQTVAYDVLNDFEPVVLLASNPQMIVSRNTIPAKDLKGLMAWLKANGGQVSAGRCRQRIAFRQRALPKGDRHALPIGTLPWR